MITHPKSTGNPGPAPARPDLTQVDKYTDALAAFSRWLEGLDRRDPVAMRQAATDLRVRFGVAVAPAAYKSGRSAR